MNEPTSHEHEKIVLLIDGNQFVNNPKDIAITGFNHAVRKCRLFGKSILDKNLGDADKLLTDIVIRGGLKIITTTVNMPHQFSKLNLRTALAEHTDYNNLHTIKIRNVKLDTSNGKGGIMLDLVNFVNQCGSLKILELENCHLSKYKPRDREDAGVGRLRIFSDNIKSDTISILTLDFCNLYWRDEFTDCLSSIITNCPSLEKMNIRIVRLHPNIDMFEKCIAKIKLDSDHVIIDLQCYPLLQQSIFKTTTSSFFNDNKIHQSVPTEHDYYLQHFEPK